MIHFHEHQLCSSNWLIASGSSSMWLCRWNQKLWSDLDPVHTYSRQACSEQGGLHPSPDRGTQHATSTQSPAPEAARSRWGGGLTCPQGLNVKYISAMLYFTHDKFDLWDSSAACVYANIHLFASTCAFALTSFSILSSLKWKCDTPWCVFML